MTAALPDTIAAYLERHETTDLLRFITCGSVDDGKSTLIGRLLYDTRLLFEDQLTALASDSVRFGTQNGELDFALLVDGLSAEREQGITIDVAYRFFGTETRKFIVADCPGHEQYTRNMATGASTADLAVVLVDARRGLLTQTRRHSYICGLLGIRHVVLAVNKMDLVAHDPQVFEAIASEYRALAGTLGIPHVHCIPVSALRGDNVIAHSDAMPWYDGPALLPLLEAVSLDGPHPNPPPHAGEGEGHAALQAEKDPRLSPPLARGGRPGGGSTQDNPTAIPFRMPVQLVNRPDQSFRGFAGTIACGQLAVGDEIVSLPSGQRSHVARIVTFDGDRQLAVAGDAITLTLTDEIDASRGDVLAAAKSPPAHADQFAVHLLWMSEQPLLPGRPYWLRLGTRTVSAQVTEIKHRVDVNTQEHLAAKRLELNEVAYCNLNTDQPLVFESFADDRALGAFILIDRQSNATVACGTIDFALRRASNVHWQHLDIDKAARARIKGQRPACLWFTGLSGSGKSTIANLVEKRLHAMGYHTYLLDGDNVRHGLNKDLGFTDEDRVENIRRVAEVAKLMVDAGLIVLVSFISPFRAERQMARRMFDEGEFFEIFVDTPLEVCEARDAKGLYRRARRGEIPNFTGITGPYEAPISPQLVLDGTHAATEHADSVLMLLAVESNPRELDGNERSRNLAQP